MTESAVAAEGQRRPMLVQNRRLGLPERGKIKIGMKGGERESKSGKTWQAPQKLDHFIITTMERGADGNFLPDHDLMADIAKRTGQKADHLTDIPVRLLWDDIELNFASRYAAYDGRTLFCAGNGERAERDGKIISCPCERIEIGYNGPQPCKINGILSVLIEGASGVGGVWKFRTTSFNSVDALTGALTFIKGVTGGKLAGLPLLLTVRPKQVTQPGTGRQQTVYVVGVEFKGTMEELQEEGYRIAVRNAEARLSFERAEQEARRLLVAPPGGVLPGDDEPDDVVDEFYPKEAEKEHRVDKSEGLPSDEFEALCRSLEEAHERGEGESWLSGNADMIKQQCSDDQRDRLRTLARELRSEHTTQAGGGASDEVGSPPADSPDTPPATSVPGKRGRMSNECKELIEGLKEAHENGDPLVWFEENVPRLEKLHEAEREHIEQLHRELNTKAAPQDGLL